MIPQRICARVVMQRPVSYRDAQGDGEARLLDLSLRGCRIEGAPPFPCGTRLRLELWLPDQFQSAKVEQAVVRWVNHDQCGVSFVKVQPETRVRLEHVFHLLHEAEHPEGLVVWKR
jgi:hypothetical protein